jgi:hypothetical protein
LEKLNSFAEENKWDISTETGTQIAHDYEEKRTDAWAKIEDLGIVKRIISVCTCIHTPSQWVPDFAQREWYKQLDPKIVEAVLAVRIRQALQGQCHRA